MDKLEPLVPNNTSLSTHMLFNTQKATFNKMNTSIKYLSFMGRVHLYLTNFSPRMALQAISNEINMIHTRTKFCSQRTGTKIQILNPLLKIKNLYPDIYHQWQNKLNHTDEELINYLENVLKKGICFGYTMALIEALSLFPEATGQELLEKFSYDTALEKNILDIIRSDLRLEPVSDFIFCSSSDVGDLDEQILRLSYYTPHLDYINNGCNPIFISETSSTDIMKRFNRQVSSSCFINLENYKIQSSKNWVYNFFDKESFIEEDEKIIKIKKTDKKQCFPIDSIVKRTMLNQTLEKRKNDYIDNNISTMSSNTILTGEIILNDRDTISHSIMFRHSNGFYYFIDSNTGSDEFKSSIDFFEGLRKHIMIYYHPISNGELEMTFIMHALNTKNQLHIFQQEESFPSQEIRL